ncbi:MAG: cell division protein SepF [Eubacterium sp.]|nr:cell division protein SepF [Eubacterium sp.]
MGFFDKFLDAVRLNDDYDDDDDAFFDDDDDYDDEPEEISEAPKRKRFGSHKTVKVRKEEEPEEPVRRTQPEPAARYSSPSKVQTRPAAQSQKVTPMRRAGASAAHSNMEVCVIKPAKVEDYREIADTLLSGCTVVLNLEGLDVELAQRIIDFSSGSCYAIGGGLQKVSSYIFILTPSSVEISGDIQDLLNGAMPTMRTAF